MSTNPEEDFFLPSTIGGMLAQMNVLNEDIKAITEQIYSTSYSKQFESDREYRIWRKKAISACQWKRRERAWLAEHYNIALRKHEQEKRSRPSQKESMNQAAHERRRKRLDEWATEHQDDTFTILMAELYAIATDVEQVPGEESPFDEHEMEVLRTVRDYLKEKGVQAG